MRAFMNKRKMSKSAHNMVINCPIFKIQSSTESLECAWSYRR